MISQAQLAEIAQARPPIFPRIFPLSRRAALFSAIGGLMLALAAPARPEAPALPASFSLAEAITLSLRDNPALRVSESRVEQRSGQLQQFSGAFDWNLFAELNAARTRNPQFSPPAAAAVDRYSELSYSAGFSRLLRSGVILRPSATVRTHDQHSPSAGVTDGGLSHVRFEILVPLLRGLGRDSTGAAEAAARGDVKVAGLLYRHALAEQTFNTAASYWASRAAEDAYAVQSDVERSAARLVESTKVLVDSRIFPPAYLLQAEANLREKRTLRINAEIEARAARYAFGQALGLPPEQIAATPAPRDPFPALADLSTFAGESTRTPLIRRALAARADYLASQESLVPLNLLARQAQLDLKPRLDLVIGAGYRGLSPDHDAIAPLRERVTGGNGSIGLSLDWPVNNRRQHGLLRERRALIAQAEAQTFQLSQIIAGEVLVALEEVRLRAEAVRSAQDTADLARRALAAQYEQLKTGDGTILDVVNLENISANARIRYISAHGAYATALARLRFALGAVFRPAADDESALALDDFTQPPAL